MPGTGRPASIPEFKKETLFMARITMLVLNHYAPDPRVHRQAKTLAEDGHEVTVLALWDKGLAFQEIVDGYQVVRLRLLSRRWRNRHAGPVLKYLAWVCGVWGWVRRHPAQIVAAHEANTLPAAWLAASLFQGAMVYDAHELETGRQFHTPHLSSVYHRIWALPERWFIRRAAAVTTVSPGISQALASFYGIHPPRVILNCPETVPLAAGSRLRRELGIPENMKILLYQGGVVPGRGIREFLEAVQMTPGFCAVVLGDGPLLPELRRQARFRGWRRVYLPGRAPARLLPEYTASADAGVALIQAVCKSYVLSLPNKLFEYIQAGIPVVGSRLPEISRIIDDYGIGEAASPDNPADIASAIRRLFDPDRHLAARQQVLSARKRFCWEHEAPRLKALYKNVEARLGHPGLHAHFRSPAL